MATSARKRKLQVDVDVLQCPVCYEEVSPPIFQCPGGHLICAACHRELSHCPSCRERLTGLRNYALERMLGQANVPCAYSEYGCKEHVQFALKKDHEVHCKYRPLMCPMPGISCQWTGQRHEVVAHLRDKHQKAVEPLPAQASAGFEFMATDEVGTLKNGDRWLKFYEFHARVFAVMLHFTNGRFYSYVNSVEEVPPMVYELMLKGPQRRLTWQGPVLCSQNEELKLRTSDCLVVSEDQVRIFAEREAGETPVIAWRFHGRIAIDPSG